MGAEFHNLIIAAFNYLGGFWAGSAWCWFLVEGHVADMPVRRRIWRALTFLPLALLSWPARPGK